MGSIHFGLTNKNNLLTKDKMTVPECPLFGDSLCNIFLHSVRIEVYICISMYMHTCLCKCIGKYVFTGNYYFSMIFFLFCSSFQVPSDVVSPQ